MTFVFVASRDSDGWRINSACLVQDCADISGLRSAKQPSWLWAEPDALASIRSPRRAFRVARRRREQAFRGTLQRLRNEAARAISDPTSGEYSDITEVYEDMLLALPQTWAAYGTDFAPGLAAGISPFELTFLDYVERDLYKEIKVALLGENIDVGLEAMRFPLRVAARAVEVRATALSSADARALGRLGCVADSGSRLRESHRTSGSKPTCPHGVRSIPRSAARHGSEALRCLTPRPPRQQGTSAKSPCCSCSTRSHSYARPVSTMTPAGPKSCRKLNRSPRRVPSELAPGVRVATAVGTRLP